MTELNLHPVTQRWPSAYPERLQLYSAPTPNGVKISIMLEETGLAYEAHRVNLSEGESHTKEFLALNPNGKIPAIIDPSGPDGPITINESIAILIYLADKTGLFLAPEGQARYETIQWAIWQVSAIGPNFGNLGYFSRFAGKDIEDKRPLQRYANESRRLLGLLDARLEGRNWIMGDEYTIADISLLGWVRGLIHNYQAGDLVGYSDFNNVARWLAAGLERPAVHAGLNIPDFKQGN